MIWRIFLDNELEHEELISYTKKLSDWLWSGRIRLEHIDSWLEHFDEKDKITALKLLSQFMFYDLKEIRQALKSMYKDLFLSPLIQGYRKRTGSYKIDDYKKYLDGEIKKTKFLGVGNPSESSSLLMYFFRQVNNLPKNTFITSCDLFDYESTGGSVQLKLKNNQTRLIIIDDLSGSGTQATRELKKTIQNIRKLDKDNQVEINYYTIFSTSKAIDKLSKATTSEGHKMFNKISQLFELDDTYKVFNGKSRYLSDCIENAGKKFEQHCRTKYHDRCDPPDLEVGDCGFDDAQLLLGFFYNIPNNTLPVFWSESKDWRPIFKRYSKNYKVGF